jgi:hypothetical protein
MKKLALVASFFLLSMCCGSIVPAAETPAPETTVSGNLIDTYCYGVMGAHGSSHQKCAITCAKRGIPVGLEEKGTGKIYVLLPKKNAQPLPKDVIDKMETEVTVSGHQFEKGGVNFLTVDSVK